jgi:ribosome-associated translation inhibitor RaiA
MIGTFLILVAIAALAWLEIRAHRNHENILTALHGAIDEVGKDVDKLRGKIDGGSMPP